MSAGAAGGGLEPCPFCGVLACVRALHEPLMLYIVAPAAGRGRAATAAWRMPQAHGTAGRAQGHAEALAPAKGG